jgi:hypothetical protein
VKIRTDAFVRTRLATRRCYGTYVRMPHRGKVGAQCGHHRRGRGGDLVKLRAIGLRSRLVVLFEGTGVSTDGIARSRRSYEYVRTSHCCGAVVCIAHPIHDRIRTVGNNVLCRVVCMYLRTVRTYVPRSVQGAPDSWGSFLPCGHCKAESAVDVYVLDQSVPTVYQARCKQSFAPGKLVLFPHSGQIYPVDPDKPMKRPATLHPAATPVASVTLEALSQDRIEHACGVRSHCAALVLAAHMVRHPTVLEEPLTSREVIAEVRSPVWVQYPCDQWASLVGLCRHLRTEVEKLSGRSL